MVYILLALIVTIITTLLLTLLFGKKDKAIEVTVAKETTEECCGAHEICEEDFLIASSAKIDYYNDEELDRFKNIPISEYTAEEIEEFRSVLFSLQEKEVAGWMKSMQLRSITLPLPIREEALLIISERRYSN